MAIDGTDLENEISCGFVFFLKLHTLEILEKNKCSFYIVLHNSKKNINMWNCSINIIFHGRINKSVFKMT